MRRLAESVSVSMLRTAYFSLFHSHLSYCLIAWGHSAIVRRIFGIQRRAIRVLAKLGYRDDCREAYVDFNILTLPSLYIYECLKYITANINSMQRNNDVHAHATRNSTNLRQPHLRLSRSRNGTNYYGIQLYNVIDAKLLELPNKEFLSRLKLYLLKKAFYSIEEFLLNPPML